MTATHGPPEPEPQADDAEAGDAITAEEVMAHEETQIAWASELREFVTGTVFRDGAVVDPGHVPAPLTPRVRGALNIALIAALERLTRLYRSDLPPEDRA